MALAQVEPVQNLRWQDKMSSSPLPTMLDRVSRDNSIAASMKILREDIHLHWLLVWAHEYVALVERISERIDSGLARHSWLVQDAAGSYLDLPPAGEGGLGIGGL